MKELIQLFESEAKHGLYQMLPPELIKKYPKLQKNSYSRRLDDKRYEWFAEKINFSNKKIIDIGANIGYFSFRLYKEKNAKITTYEPNKKHNEAISKVKKELNINENFSNIAKGIDKDAIESLPKSDIILLFNVVQHAGEDFDSKYVPNQEKWFDYAVEYLTKISKKTKFIVFQTGYTWLGHDTALCKENEIIDFSVNLIYKAGLEIVNCGLIQDVVKPEYKDFEIKKSENIHPILNKRKELLSKIMNKLKISNNDYRFMQRPIFICKNIK